MKFTDKSIKELKIKPAVYEVSDDELPRLKVRVQPSGSKVFYAYFRLQSGKERKFKIGRFGEITCKEARAGAQAVLAKAALGSDPLSEKHEAREQERRERSCCVPRDYIPLRSYALFEARSILREVFGCDVQGKTA